MNEKIQSLMKKLAYVDSVREASNAILFDFERPADQSEAVQSIRERYAQDYYDDFALTNKLLLEEDDNMRYNSVTEMPEWAQPTIQKMIDKGLLGGTGGKDKLDLTLEMIRVFVINDRAGLY